MIEKVIAEIKSMVKHTVTICLLFFVWKGVSQEITGFTYHNNLPLPDVNISVKNSSKNTVSNGEGKFVIKTSIGDTLIFSHIGMVSVEKRIEQLDALKIHLIKRVTELDEVEVKNRKSKFSKPKTLKSIFGEIEVDKLGYTAYSFSKEEIQSYSFIGIPETLLGRVPNYKLTNDGVILRSQSFGLDKPRPALWDIDGMLFDGLPPFIEPETIESVLVIPSTAGTVPYGKRGAGGVIVVNTNRFKSWNKPKIILQQLNSITFKRNELPTNATQLSILIKTEKSLEKLKSMALAYDKIGKSILALRLNRMLFSYSPHDITAYRDLGESLLKNNRKNEAWNIYLAYLDKYGEAIDKTAWEIIINDMERLYHSYGLKKTIGNKFDSKINPKTNEEETRVVFEWTVPNESLSIEIINPNNQSIHFPLGSSSAQVSSIQELFLDGKIKGNWKMNLKVNEEIEPKGFLKVTIYQNWSSSKKLSESNMFSITEDIKGSFKLMNITL